MDIYAGNWSQTGMNIFLNTNTDDFSHDKIVFVLNSLTDKVDISRGNSSSNFTNSYLLPKIFWKKWTLLEALRDIYRLMETVRSLPETFENIKDSENIWRLWLFKRIRLVLRVDLNQLFFTDRYLSKKSYKYLVTYMVLYVTKLN